MQLKKEFTVAGFLADVELIKEGQMPVNLGIGIKKTDFQAFLDKEENEK